MDDSNTSDDPPRFRLGLCTSASVLVPRSGTKLESLGNNVINEAVTVVSSCGCKTRTCAKCGKHLGYNIRQRLLQPDKLAFWKRPGLFTLTVDRRRFADPEAAFKHITGLRFVARLMKLLRVKRWLWALEFQQKTGDGWPHWHLLIDLADLNRNKLNLKRAWHFWREKWQLGGLQLEAKKTKLANAEHAIFYITKYLTKMPEGGFPVWVLNTHGIRFAQGCRKLGPLVANPKSERSLDKREPRKNQPRRAMIERMSECGTTSRVYSMKPDHDAGQLESRFVGTLPVSPTALIAYANLGEVEADVTVGDVFGKDAVILRSGAVRELREALENKPGVKAGRLKDVEKKRNSILFENAYRKRLVDAESAGTKTVQADEAERAGESGPASGSDPAP